MKTYSTFKSKYLINITISIVITVILLFLFIYFIRSNEYLKLNDTFKGFLGASFGLFFVASLSSIYFFIASYKNSYYYKQKEFLKQKSLMDEMLKNEFNHYIKEIQSFTHIDQKLLEDQLHSIEKERLKSIFDDIFNITTFIDKHKKDVINQE